MSNESRNPRFIVQQDLSEDVPGSFSPSYFLAAPPFDHWLVKNKEFNQTPLQVFSVIRGQKEPISKQSCLVFFSLSREKEGDDDAKNRLIMIKMLASLPNDLRLDTSASVAALQTRAKQ